MNVPLEYQELVSLGEQSVVACCHIRVAWLYSAFLKIAFEKVCISE